MSALTWAGEHPWLTLLFVVVGFDYVRSIIIRFFRVIKVAMRGWPPPHLDADGDWKPEKEEP